MVKKDRSKLVNRFNTCVLIFFLVLGGVAFGAEVIVDNDGGSPGYIETGSWITSGSTGYAGGTYRFANAGESHTATWTADLPESGAYEIQLWYREGSNRTTSTQYNFSHTGGPETVYVDQTVTGQAWFSLGEYTFNAGSNSITLNASGSSGGSVVIADAIRFITPVGSEIAPGVFHTVHTLAGPLVVHVVEFDLDDPDYTIEMGFPQGKRNYSSREGTSQIVTHYDTVDDDVIAAINCGYFGSGIDIIGPLASGGNLIGLPTNTWETCILQESAEGWMDRNLPSATGTLTFDGGSTQGINLLNVARTADSLVLYTPVWDATTGTTTQGVEVIVENVSFPMRPDKQVVGEVTAIYTGTGSLDNAIPAGGMVLSAAGTAATTLQANVTVGDVLAVRFDMSPGTVINTRLMTAGAGWLVEGGVPNTSAWAYFSFSTELHPRTVLAWNGTKHWFVTFDGRQAGYSIGADFEDMADFLIGTLGADQAINLDGGGSTTMVINGSIVNQPSDSGGERSVGNALMLVQRDSASTLPLSDDFTFVGRSLPWDDKFTYSSVVSFSPAAPGGDGYVMEVMDPAGGYESTSAGSPGDVDYAVEAYIYCDYRPGLAGDGYERVGIFARDDGNSNFDTTSYSGGNCYALTFDTDDGQIQACVIVDGVITNFLAGSPVYETSDDWRHFRIECFDNNIRFLLDGLELIEVYDTSHTNGRAGVGYHDYFATNSNMAGTHVESFQIEALTTEVEGWWQLY